MGARERWSEDDGFTLMELAIVTIIIGILATIAIAVFLTQRDKAQMSVAKSAIRNGSTYAEIVREDRPTYSAETAMYSAEAPSGYSFTNGESSEPQELSLATFESGQILVIAAKAAGTCLYLRLDAGGDSGLRGHHDGAHCTASELEEASGNGWP